jgi:hypothetical protein
VNYLDIEVISFKNTPIDGKLEAMIHYHEMRDALGYSASVNVWVPVVESRSQLEDLAKKEAKNFLERALSAHSS